MLNKSCLFLILFPFRYLSIVLVKLCHSIKANVMLLIFGVVTTNAGEERWERTRERKRNRWRDAKERERKRALTIKRAVVVIFYFLFIFIFSFTFTAVVLFTLSYCLDKCATRLSVAVLDIAFQVTWIVRSLHDQW